LKLVDELIDDIAQPLNGQVELKWCLGAENGVEQIYVVFV
jgi:hypothetical protein